MSLQGLPDFQQPLQGEGFQIFRPYEGVGNHLVTPDQLEVAEGADGRPEFLLEFVRGQNPALPPAPYGMLDMRIRPRYPMETALTLLRSLYPEALLDPALFSGGFLRLYPEGGSNGVPADLRVPISLAWNGLTTGRYVLRLSQEGALLLKGALQGEILALIALAEMEMIGIAPRLPVRVRFNPAMLLSSLNALGNKERQVAREGVVQLFRQDPASLPLEVVGDIPNRSEFAETMTDWIRVRFASFIPSPEDDGKPHWVLKSAEEVGRGSFEWDLSQPLQTYRPFILRLHPLESARQLVKEKGIEAVTRNTTLPSIPTGVFPVSISANLPSHRPGILSIGVTLKAAPRLPFRPQAVIESAEFALPDDRTTLYLRLSPGENPEYTYSTFVLREDSSGITQLDGVETHHEGGSLYLSPTDFPVDFIPLDASQSLLDLAVLDGTCHWKQAGKDLEQSFKLAPGQPAIGLALPKDAEGAMIEIKAHSRSDAATVTFGPVPAKGLELGLYSFREFGPHAVRINCTFNDDKPLLAIDLLPEDRPETSEEISVIALTPAQPSKEWTYFARSPFHFGYRYRLHPRADEAPGAWSEIRSPFDSFKLYSGGSP